MSCTRALSVVGWLVAAAFLVLGVPLFLRMPLWCDATLYGVAAQTLLTGGVHYRDVFDTNPPGFVWLLCGVRVVLGPSSEVVRAVDLGIVLIVTVLLLQLARRAGATPPGLAWTAAAIAAFYPFTHEFNHVQRDVWMMLPAMLAVGLRVRAATGQERLPVGWTFLEGLLWGLGCWIKPQLLCVAAAAWLVTQGRGGSPRPRRWEFVAVFSGGLAAGLAGLGWLIASGSWPHFVDVWQNWNTDYASMVWRELPFRMTKQLEYFPPYSLCALLALPLALGNLRGRFECDPVRYRRAILAAVYLAWLLSALLLQRGYHYAHIPETLLMLALFAANRWPVAAVLVLVQLVTPLIVLTGERHVAFDGNRNQWWAGCWQREIPPELRQGVARWVNHFGGHDSVQLAAVAEFLRREQVQDGELLAWHDSPHALYLELGVRPGFRFLHVSTVWSLGPWQREQVLRELQEAVPHIRFVVSDMHRVTAKYDDLAAGVDPLPAWQREHFPFDQPVVFRSPGGRYLVHRLVKPVTSCVLPDRLDQVSPEPQR